MEIKNKRVLVFGGAGLVGMAICRRVIAEGPDELIVASLTEAEATEACEILTRETGGNILITPAWGDIFLRQELQGYTRQQLLEDPEARRKIIEDVLGEFNQEILSRSYLYQMLKRFRPHIVIDCVNSATAVAYQDVFKSYFRLTQHLELVRKTGQVEKDFVTGVEQLLCTLYVPQLIRHVQILYESMRQVKTEYYFKIGTSGTGGMGLNIPYTHSEEKPSRV
ncbi:MAG: short-chain dehydrogenase, partial [Calditrichaeota bacterium]